MQAAVWCKLFAHFNLLSLVLKAQKMFLVWVHIYTCAAKAFCVLCLYKVSVVCFLCVTGTYSQTFVYKMLGNYSSKDESICVLQNSYQEMIQSLKHRDTPVMSEPIPITDTYLRLYSMLGNNAEDWSLLHSF